MGEYKTATKNIQKIKIIKLDLDLKQKYILVNKTEYKLTSCDSLNHDYRVFFLKPIKYTFILHYVGYSFIRTNHPTPPSLTAGINEIIRRHLS